MLGGFSFLSALCRVRSGNVPSAVGAALGLTVSLILGGFLLLGLRRLLFSAGDKPYLSLRLKKGEDALRAARALVADYAAGLESEPAT